MDYQIDRDTTHLVIRGTITGPVLTEELADDYYRALVLAHGGPYAAIFDFSAVTGTTLSPDAVRGLAGRAPAVPAGRPRVIVADEPWIFGLALMFQICKGFPERTISRRPIIGGSLRNGWRASRRFHAAYLPQRAGRLNRTSKGVWPCSVVRLHLASDWGS